MQAILSVFGSLFGLLGASFTGILSGLLARKITTALATLASFVFLTAAFLVCIKTAITYVLTLAVIPSWIVTGIGTFIPYNFTAILSSILGAQSCRWAYDKAIDKVRLINSSN